MNANKTIKHSVIYFIGESVLKAMVFFISLSRVLKNNVYKDIGYIDGVFDGIFLY